MGSQCAREPAEPALRPATPCLLCARRADLFGRQNIGTTLFPICVCALFFLFPPHFLHGLGGNLVNYLRLGGWGHQAIAAGPLSALSHVKRFRRDAAAPRGCFVSGIRPPGLARPWARPWVTVDPFVQEQRAAWREGWGTEVAVPWSSP